MFGFVCFFVCLFVFTLPVSQPARRSGGSCSTSSFIVQVGEKVDEDIEYNLDTVNYDYD